MQNTHFYKNQNGYFRMLERKGNAVLFNNYNSLGKSDFDQEDAAITFFKNKEKEILKDGLKKVQIKTIEVPVGLNSLEEVISVFNEILEKEALFSVLDFLKLIDKTTRAAFVKELKKYRKDFSEYKENNKGAWSRKGSDIQIDCIALAAMALMNKTDVKSWTEVYSLLKNVEFSYVDDVLNHFKPTWLNEFILERSLKTDWGRIQYQQIIYLENKGCISFDEELFALCVSEINFWNYEHITDASFIFTNEKTYQRDVPLLFEYPSNLHNQSTEQVDGEKREKAWNSIFKLLINQGKLDRFFVLEKCVDIQVKNWNNGQLSFFRTLFDDLQPSLPELIQLQNQLFLLLPISNKTVYNFAVKNIKKIALENEFNKQEFIDWSSSVLNNFDAKTSIVSILQIFDKFLKKHPELLSNILLKISEVFIINDYEVQQRATSLIVKYGKESDAALVENLKMYKSQMLGSICIELAFLIGNDVESYDFFEEENEEENDKEIELEFKKISVFDNWDDIFYAVGNAINSDEPIDFEIVLNAFLTQKHLFPTDFDHKLKIYIKAVNEKHKGNAAKYDLTILLNLILNNGAEKVKFTNDEESNKLVLIRKHLIEYVFELYNSKRNVSLLSMPTHYPNFIEANVLLERLVNYQNKSIKINQYDLMIAINRMIPKFDSKSTELINKLTDNYKQLFEIFSEENDEMALQKVNYLLLQNSSVGNKNVFQKALSFIGKQNKILEKVIDDKMLNHFEINDKSFFDCAIMASRLRLPFAKFDALENTIYKNILFAMTDCNAKLSNKKVVYTYVDYNKTTKFDEKIELVSDFVITNEKTYFYYSYNIKNAKTKFTDFWEYAFNYSEGLTKYDIKTYFGLMPFYTEPIFASLYFNEFRRASFFSETTSSVVLKEMLALQFKMGYFSNWFLACSQFADKKEVRLLSTEVVIQLIENRKLNEQEFVLRIIELFQSKYGTIQRVIENLSMLKDVSNKHNEFLCKTIERLLIAFAKETKVPTNTKKIVEILYDLKVKSNEKIPEELRVSLETWRQNSTLKKLVDNLLKL